jgi:hypothetical protein
VSRNITGIRKNRDLFVVEVVGGEFGWLGRRGKSGSFACLPQAGTGRLPHSKGRVGYLKVAATEIRETQQRG